MRCLSFLRNQTLNTKWHDDSTLETIIVTLSRVLALVKRRRFRRETDKKEETETVHLQYDDFMMSLSSLSFVHPKNVVGFHPIREKSRSNVMKKQRRRRRLHAKTPQTRAMAAVQDEEATKPQPEPANWEYKYLYDGACPVCRSLKAGLEGKRTLSLREAFCVLGWVFKIRFCVNIERAWISNDS